MSDGQITNGQRAAHALDGINAHAQSSSRPPRAIHDRSRITDPEGAIPGRESSPGFPGKAGSYGRSRRP